MKKSTKKNGEPSGTKPRKKPKEPVKCANAYPLLVTANSFAKAQEILEENISDSYSKEFRSTVLATLGALSLELYLKCLLVLEHGWYVEEHDAGILFALLRPETKKAVESRWTKLVKDSDWFQELGGSLQAVLEVGKNAFVKFRYPFEPRSKGVIWALDGLTLVVEYHITKSVEEGKYQWLRHH